MASFSITKSTKRINAPLCPEPDCGGRLQVAEGCSKCLACGLSFCG